MESRSFGVDDPSTLEAFRSGRGLPNSRPRLGPVVINELMYHPNTAAGNASTEQTKFEFLELRNISERPVLLFDPDYPTNTWQLRGGIDFIFPQNLTCPLAEYWWSSILIRSKAGCSRCLPD